MCFLYRQSISIVYESKFKYIYRYFIKIDRCFCGILQSLPSRKCGLKCHAIANYERFICHFPRGSVDWNKLDPAYVITVPVTSLAEVWIEIVWEISLGRYPTSHFPRGSVDWNDTMISDIILRPCHFPRGSVDWNSSKLIPPNWSKMSLPSRKCGLKCPISRIS